LTASFFSIQLAGVVELIPSRVTLVPLPFSSAVAEQARAASSSPASNRARRIEPTSPWCFAAASAAACQSVNGTIARPARLSPSLFTPGRRRQALRHSPYIRYGPPDDRA